MIFIILGIIIAITASWSMSDNYGSWWDRSWFMFIFMLGLFGVMAFIVGGLIAMGVGYSLPQHPYVDSTVELVALKDSDGSKGSFFLFAGYINSIMSYSYYMKVGENIYKPESMPEGKVLIFEDEETKPRLEYVKSKFDKEWYYWIGAPSKDYRNSFHVPKGSVKKQINLDL